MPDELKGFSADYKKCTNKSKDCTVAAATILLKKFLNCKSSVSTGFEQLADDVSSAQENGVTGKKIQDYVGDKNVLDSLKGIKKYQSDQLAAWNDLEDIESRAVASENCLNKLANDIAKDLKKRSKSKQRLKNFWRRQQMIFASFDAKS